MNLSSAQSERKPSIYLDATELVYFRKRPTGIPRVVIETIRGLVKSGYPKELLFFYFDLHTRCLHELSVGKIRELLETEPSDEEPLLSRESKFTITIGRLFGKAKTLLKKFSWLFRLMYWLRVAIIRSASQLKKRGPTKETLSFNPNSMVISLGSSWNFQEFPDLLRHSVESKKCQVVLFIHDLIPVKMPHYFDPAFAAAFESWFTKVSQLCSGYVVNSKSTAVDLSAVLAQYNHENIPPIQVLRLGDNLPKTTFQSVEQLEGKKFILCLSTVESRKNHYSLYLAWKALRDHLSDEMLVIVGKEGRNSQFVLDLLLRDPHTQSRILHLKSASDGIVSWLIQNCMFTVYPSLYEGWGLPVAESLCAGKYCIASNASSIPEIGGDLVDYHHPLDWQELSRLILRAASDSEYLRERERLIMELYTPRDWSSTAIDLLNFVHEKMGS